MAIQTRISSIQLTPFIGIILILVFGIPRFVLVMNASITGNYQLVSILFIVMAAAPWLLLDRKGRRAIGIKKPENPAWLVQSVLIGLIACGVVFFLGKWLFFDTYNNWFVYLSKAYMVESGPDLEQNRVVYFILFAFIGMTFSPVGEEILYRGLIHESFAERTGHYYGSLIDSGAFAVTHLAHFGIVYVNEGWKFLLLPSLMWVILMFLVSRLFYIAREKTGSVLGAVVCHAAFNVAMAWFMVYVILS